MVKIIGTEKRSSNGRTFNVLILQGGIIVAKSKTTGKTYLTAHRVSTVCTLDEANCKQQIGSLLPGTIEKVACAPYDFKLPQTGEIVKLDYTFQYNPETVSAEEAAFA